MDTNKAIETLRTKATADKALDAVLHMWALRERARNVVTVVALSKRMDREGYKFKPAEYEEVLKLVASLGFGKLLIGPKGQIKALRDVSVTLQSIGNAVTGRGSLERFRPRNRYAKLPVPTPAPTAPVIEEKAPEANLSLEAGTLVILTFMLKGKPLSIHVPKGLTPAEIADIVARLQ